VWRIGRGGEGSACRRRGLWYRCHCGGSACGEDAKRRGDRNETVGMLVKYSVPSAGLEDIGGGGGVTACNEVKGELRNTWVSALCCLDLFKDANLDGELCMHSCVNDLWRGVE